MSYEKKKLYINFYQRVDLECLRERKMLVRERSRKQKCSAKVAKDDVYMVHVRTYKYVCFYV